jgi:hypothetical protein
MWHIWGEEKGVGGLVGMSAGNVKVYMEFIFEMNLRELGWESLVS